MCKTAKANRPGRLGVFVGITGTVVVTKALLKKQESYILFVCMFDHCF